MLRSSKHTLNYTNVGKINVLYQLRQDYRKMVEQYVDILWQDPLNCPSFLDSKTCNTITTRTARLRQCAAKQACAMVGAATKKRIKQLFKLKQLMREGKHCKKLQAKINKFPLVKPTCDNINPVLDGRFIDIRKTDNHFDIFVQVSSVGNKEQVRIPLNNTKVSNKWLKLGKISDSIRIDPDAIVLFYKADEPKNTGNRTIGADQGKLTCLSLSDGQVTQKNKHGHDLNTILDIMARKKKDTHAFRRCQTHRKNYVNWSINNLNFNNVKRMNLERIANIRRGKHTNRKMSHWTYTLIKQKLIMLSEDKGFVFNEQDNKYRSQRCNQYGYVHKSNRKGETFLCGMCNHYTDADLNAASNHEVELYELPYSLVWLRQIAVSGFYWTQDAILNVSHECIVRDTAGTNLP